MEHKRRNVVAALILGSSIVIASVIFAYSQRYVNDGYAIIDLWKKEIIVPKEKK